MPFTLAHPAVVLPLARPPCVPLALAAGAMAPDVPYYVRATSVPVTADSWYEPFVNATTTHALSGLATVDLVLSALVWLAVAVSVPPLAAVVLGWEGVRVPVPRPSSAAGVVVAVVATAGSLLVGAATHLAWDAVTHGNATVVGWAPFLAASAVGAVTWAGLLQQVSTVVGLAVVGGYLVVLWRWRRPPGRPGLDRRRVLVVVAVVAVAGVAGGLATVAARSRDGLPLRTVVEAVAYDLATGGVLAVAVLTAVVVAGWWATRAVRP